MLQFGAGLAVTSNPFCVNGEQFLSRNREMLGDMSDGGREASPMRPVPIGDNPPLFDHLVGAANKWQRDCKAECLGGLQIDG
jgi:hypothetical protein